MTYIQQYWQQRLTQCKTALEANNFEAFVADDSEHASQIIIEEILPHLDVQTVSWGDSLTLEATGVLDVIAVSPILTMMKTFEEHVPRKELIERRRQALNVDLFLTGSNAVTASGMLINLDMVGNRVAALTFGPKYVVIVAGRNKLVADLEQGMARVKNVAAPVNAIRHNCQTPCVNTSSCHDCQSPGRICNTWVITEKSYPKGRIKVVLINEVLGL